jgi:DNA-binding MarR family transcriptional regulator
MLAYMQSNRQGPDLNSSSDDAASRIERALAALRRGGGPFRGGPFAGPRPPGGPFPGGPFGTGGFGTGQFPPFGRRPGSPATPSGDEEHEGHDGPGPFGPRHPHWHRGDAGPGGFARFRALEALEAGPRTVTELAELIGVDQPRASRLVAFGVKAGLLRKAQDPADARRAIIELTDAGGEAMAAARARRRSSLDRGLASFTPDEADRFATDLERFVAGWMTVD